MKLQKKIAFGLIAINALCLFASSVQVQAGVPGQYKGLRLPYAAGQRRQVTGTHDRANGRHAIDFGMTLENVLAMRAGVVRTYTWDSSGGGNMLIIDHGDDFWRWWQYANY